MRKIAINVAQSLQMPDQQRKMQSLFLRHLQPVAVIIGRHAGKAPDRIQGQIDGIEFNVGECMDQRGAPGQ